MFEKYFGLRENPFHSGHQLRFLYPSREHQEARAHLRYGIENREPFVLITGEVGTGKTTALYDALAEWGSQVAVALITNSALTRQELIEEIGLRFGLTVPTGATKPQSLALLERHLTTVRARGEHAVLLLDEAQNLAPELLEEIRLLSNLEVQGEKLVQIFLVGQPELEAVLADPNLRQLRQRISVHYRLNPLSPEETGAYIHHRVGVAGGNPWVAFPPETCLEVYRVTHGIPREINTVASQAMTTAFSEGSTTVRPEHVKESTRESEFRSVLSGVVAEADPPMPGLVTARVAPLPAPVAAEPEPAAPTPPSPRAADPAPVPVVDAPSAPIAEKSAPEPAPAWTPPELTAVPVAPAAEPSQPEAAPSYSLAEAKQAVDAWTAAAQELMEARRRGSAPENAPLVEIVGKEAFVPPPASASAPAPTPEPAPAPELAPAPTPVIASPAAEPAPKFPTPAELYARGENARPESADLSGLPGRLRDKIAADIAAEEARDANKRRAVPLMLALVSVAALAAGAVMLQKMQVIDLPALRGIAGTHPTASSTAAHVGPQVASGDQALPLHERALAAVKRDSLVTKLVTSTTSTPPPAEKPVVSAPVAAAKPTPAPAAPVAHAAVAPSHDTMLATRTPQVPVHATAVPAPVAAAPKPAAPANVDAPVFGLGVASYLDRDRADQERTRLASKSGLPATVIAINDAGTPKFCVVIGRYASNAAAERAALPVMEKLDVGEARPMKLPKAASN